MNAEHFTTTRTLVRGFANAMNLVSPEVQNHHEKVAYFAYRLAEAMGLNETERQLAFFGALFHDIGGFLNTGTVSLAELERHAKTVSTAGAALLKSFRSTRPFAEIVEGSQTPWQAFRLIPSKIRNTLQISQIVHLADAVTLLMNDTDSALNQVPRIRSLLHCAENREFGSDVLSAFDRVAEKEIVWLDLFYDPDRFLDFMPGDRPVSLDQTLLFTEFMSRIIDFRSPFTAMHSAGVAATAKALAECSGMSEEDCKVMQIAGFLHDIGKLRIPNAILEKPGSLSDSEFNIIKEHSYYTFIILRELDGFERITEWAAYHHEKLDGSGYPFHLRADELSAGARIMAVADIFSAITEDRPYRKGMRKEKALAVLRGDAGKGKIDRDTVELLADRYETVNERRRAASYAASRNYRKSLEQAERTERSNV